MHFFMQLLDIALPPRETELIARNLTDTALRSCLRPRSVPLPRFSHPTGITTLTLYSDAAVRAAIKEAKFHGNKRAARMLGSIVAIYLQTLKHENAVLVPVPLSAKRRRERGYNQVERIARSATRALSDTLPLRTDILYRVRDTEKQTSLGRHDRLKNIEGAFALRSTIDTRATYIVLDDVTTTGATLAAAITPLQKAGAQTILPIAVAYQPIGNGR